METKQKRLEVTFGVDGADGTLRVEPNENGVEQDLIVCLPRSQKEYRFPLALETAAALCDALKGEYL